MEEDGILVVGDCEILVVGKGEIQVADKDWLQLGYVLHTPPRVPMDIVDGRNFHKPKEFPSVLLYILSLGST